MPSTLWYFDMAAPGNAMDMQQVSGIGGCVSRPCLLHGIGCTLPFYTKKHTVPKPIQVGLESFVVAMLGWLGGQRPKGQFIMYLVSYLYFSLRYLRTCSFGNLYEGPYYVYIL